MREWPGDKLPPVAMPPSAGKLPPGLRVAGMGARLGAWLIDTAILGVLFFMLVVLASSVGAIGLNPDAQQQLQNNPFALPSVPVYHTDLRLLAIFSVLYVVLNTVYAAFFTVRYRGLPGQRMLSLQVADAATGRNLEWKAAIMRAALSIGIPTAGFAGSMYGILALMSSVPWSEFVNPQPGGPAEVWMSTWAAPIYIAMGAFLIWPFVLLIWTGANSDRQGLHDLAARSQVVGREKVVWSGYPYAQHPYAGAMPSAQTPPPWAQGYPPPGYVAPTAATGAAPTAAPDPQAGPDDQSPPQHLKPDEMPWLHSWQQSGPPASSADIQPSGAPVWVRSEDDGKPFKMKSATIGRRIAAYAMDNVMILMILLLISSLMVQTVLRQPVIDTTHPIEERSMILIGLIGGLIQIIYFVPAWAISRGTLGQRILHLDVSDATTGKPLSWMDSFLRWAVLQGPVALYWIVPTALQLIVVIGASLWVSYLLYTAQNSPDWRGVHDRFVNSRVAQE